MAQLNITMTAVDGRQFVDCKTIGNLPLITISIGSQKISLVGRDYVQQIPVEPSDLGLVKCVLLFRKPYTSAPIADKNIPLGAMQKKIWAQGRILTESVYYVQLPWENYLLYVPYTLVIIEPERRSSNLAF